MKLSDYDIRQLNEEKINSLSRESVATLACRLLTDLIESRERLNQNSQNSSKPSGSEPPWDKPSSSTESDSSDEEDGAQTEDEALDEGNSEEEQDSEKDDETPDDESAPPKSKEKSKRKAGKQKGAQGFGRTQKLPVHRYEHHHPEECAICAKRFLFSAPSIAYTAFYSLDIDYGNIDHPGIVCVNTKHTYYQKECLNCGHITRKEPFRQMPDSEFPNTTLSEWRLVAPGLASLIVCLAFRMRLSRARIREFLHDWLGIDLAIGTINNTIHEAGRAARPVEDELIKEVVASKLLHVDETSWKQKKELFWLWVFVSSTIVAFFIAKRSRDLIERVLGSDYKGWIMSDGYQVYRKFLNRLRCWAHLIRKARGLSESLECEVQVFGQKAVFLFNTLIGAIREARKIPPDAPLSSSFKDPLNEFKNSCEKMLNHEHKKARAFAVEMINDWDVIFTILDHPHLPLTNNEAERALRHWVILRKISFGTRTKEGSRVFAILASVIETCRIRNRSPWKYLTEIISNQRAGLTVPPLPLPIKVEGV
jgi:hypothetical protein